jgi:hypothetical protein
MIENNRKMVLDWMRKIHQLEYAQRYESLQWSLREKWIGISAFGLSTLIAFSYQFPNADPATYQHLPFYFRHGFLVAFSSTVVAILTGVQIFLKPSEKADIHKNAGRNYEKLRHRIVLILSTDYPEAELKKRIDAIRLEWEDLEISTPRNCLLSKI